jgi:hypothetical protein
LLISTSGLANVEWKTKVFAGKTGAWSSLEGCSDFLQIQCVAGDAKDLRLVKVGMQSCCFLKACKTCEGEPLRYARECQFAPQLRAIGIQSAESELLTSMDLMEPAAATLVTVTVHAAGLAPRRVCLAVARDLVALPAGSTILEEHRAQRHRNHDRFALVKAAELRKEKAAGRGGEKAQALACACMRTAAVPSLYTVINFRGVKPVFIPSVWKVPTLQGSRFSFGYYPIAS